MKQHLVSRAILRRFVNERGGPVGFLDMKTLDIDEDSVNNLAFVEDLLSNDAADLEQKWDRQVENRLAAAFKAVDAREMLTAPAVKITLRRLIALHWARGFALQHIHETLQHEKAVQAATSMLGSFSPNQIMTSLTGVAVPDTPASYFLAHDRLQLEFHHRIEESGFLRSQLEHHYSEALRRLEEFEFELWHTDSLEFVMGDCPAVTWDRQDDKVGVLGGAAWDQSDHLFMVLGPHAAIAIAREPLVREAPPRLVEVINVLQARGSFKQVFFRPGSGLGDLLANSIRANEESTEATED